MLMLRRFSLSTLSFQFSVAKPKKQKTYYQMLEVPPNATPTIIKKNYLKLAKIYHPDVYKGADKTRFQRIQQAYKILSNQGERSKYDQTIGIKSNYHPDSQENSQAKTNQTDPKYGKPPNDFKYTKPKVQINIDEEYQKFFKKKSKTNFQEIRLHESTEFKAMSQSQRIRRRFTEVYTDPKLDLKMRFSKSYGQILDDQINQKNEYQQQLRKRQKQNEARNSQKEINKKKKLIYAGGFIVFVFMIPFILSFKTKLQLEREAKESYEKRVRDLFTEMENSQVRDRLRFD